MPLALEGIKVIDMSRTGPAAHCSMVLGDLGAEVLKVEEPVISNPWRRIHRGQIIGQLRSGNHGEASWRTSY